MWLEENADKSEAIQLKNNYISIQYALGSAYCEYKNIDTTEDKSPIYKYSFEYIATFENNSKYRFMATIKDGYYLPFETKETIAGVDFYYYDSEAKENFDAILGNTNVSVNYYKW